MTRSPGRPADPRFRDPGYLDLLLLRFEAGETVRELADEFGRSKSALGRDLDAARAARAAVEQDRHERAHDAAMQHLATSPDRAKRTGDWQPGDPVPRAFPADERPRLRIMLLDEVAGEPVFVDGTSAALHRPRPGRRTTYSDPHAKHLAAKDIDRLVEDRARRRGLTPPTDPGQPPSAYARVCDADGRTLAATGYQPSEVGRASRVTGLSRELLAAAFTDPATARRLRAGITRPSDEDSPGVESAHEYDGSLSAGEPRS